jgi:hypothetical protein
MEKRIDLTELLRDCPKGMELNCMMYDNATLDTVGIDGIYPIKITTKSGFSTRLTKYGQNVDNTDAKCVIFPKGKTTWEGFQRPFKDGDILVSKAKQPFIFQSFNSNNGCCSYCGIDAALQFRLHSDDWAYVNFLRFATEEEKEKLFQAIKDNGYKWNAETKTLERLVEPKFKVGDNIRIKGKSVIHVVTGVREKLYILDTKDISLPLKVQDQDQWELVSNKFDITTLKPFDKVLARDNDTQEWRISFFSHCNGLGFYKYSCINGNGYAQCIPFEGNEYLLGKTNDCKNFYKTWE